MIRNFILALSSIALMSGVSFGGSSVKLADKPNVAKDPTHEVRRVMAVGADRTLEKDAVNRVLDLVNQTDRDRLAKEITKGDDKAYQAEADKVRKMWKDKYDQDFKAESHIDDLGDLNVHFSGEGKDQTAIVDFPAEPGEKAYELHLMRDPKSGWWEIQLPDSFDGKSFFNNLMNSVKQVEEQKDKLPGGVNKAYARVTPMLLHEMAFPAGAK